MRLWSGRGKAESDTETAGSGQPIRPPMLETPAHREQHGNQKQPACCHFPHLRKNSGETA